MTQSTKNIVLVHGGFVDGSGWEGVYSLLKKDDYNVAIVQNPTLSLAGDVAATKLVIHEQDGPVILVGHSYGGAVITEAGTDPQVVGLVYITAFAPDKGESVNSLIKDPPPDAPVPPILPPRDGYLFLDKSKFRASFAGDVEAEKAAFMADSQVPWGLEALGGEISEPAWKSKAKLVPTGDRRQNDSAAGPAFHVCASRIDSRGGGRQSRNLRVAAKCGGGAHQTSCTGSCFGNRSELVAELFSEIQWCR